MGKENGFNHDYGDNDNDNVSGIGKKVLLLFRAQEKDPQKTLLPIPVAIKRKEHSRISVANLDQKIESLLVRK